MRLLTVYLMITIIYSESKLAHGIAERTHYGVWQQLAELYVFGAELRKVPSLTGAY